MVSINRNDELTNENTKNKERLDDQEFSELSCFFDLLARFDYEDKQKEKLVAETGPLVSAPRGSVSGSDI
jgi:hypothetical protein